MAPGLTIAGAILAGGRGERLGGLNKALIEIGGQRMIDRVAAAMAGCDPILLCAGDNTFGDDVSIAATDRLRDLPTEYGGPLAGVAAAVAALQKRGAPAFLLTSAVDTPFMPHDFATRALSLIGEADVVVGRFEGQDYPTQALWRFGALQTIPETVAKGTAPHSLKRLIAARRSVALDLSDLSENPFANANTPEDLAALSARMKP